MSRAAGAGAVALIALVCGCTAAPDEPGPGSSTHAPPLGQSESTRPTTTASPSTDPVSGELADLATAAGLTDLERAPYSPQGIVGVAGWWDYMYVAIWVGTAPITPPDAIEAGEISLAGTTALRFDDPEHGPLATFSCDGQHVLVGILGVDDNVIGTDPLPRYAEAVATTAC